MVQHIAQITRMRAAPPLLFLQRANTTLRLRFFHSVIQMKLQALSRWHYTLSVYMTAASPGIKEASFLRYSPAPFSSLQRKHLELTAWWASVIFLVLTINSFLPGILNLPRLLEGEEKLNLISLGCPRPMFKGSKFGNISFVSHHKGEFRLFNRLP